MGLDTQAKGLSYENGYHGGYIRFNIYRNIVAESYNTRLGELYHKSLSNHLTENEIKEWNSLCNDDLDIFLWHSDCDGKFTPKECRKIYNVMKDLKIDMQGYNCVTMELYNMHERWLNIFKHCCKKQVNLYFY